MLKISKFETLIKILSNCVSATFIKETRNNGIMMPILLSIKFFKSNKVKLFLQRLKLFLQFSGKESKYYIIPKYQIRKYLL